MDPVSKKRADDPVEHRRFGGRQYIPFMPPPYIAAC
jgi:hypothetical protein